MSDIAADEPQTLSDEAVLARFQATANLPTGSKTLGFRMLRVDQAAMTVEVGFEASAERLCNPMGQIQGGYVCAMLDEAMSVAGLVASRMTCVVPTLEMKTSFLRPAMPGALKAIGRVAKWGRTVAFLEGELYDDQGRLLAKASATAIPTPFKSFRK